MLVVFLILFTKILADSDEDKYVDLLPDEEKQQFIENVARRILKDVQTQETGKAVKSGELSEEQLIKHNEFVKTILKQEADYVRRSKDEPNKDEDDKSVSEEKNLGVKPLESEKLAIPDDTDLDRVDLTLRNDRREINDNDENSTDLLKDEIVTDAAPKIKRSVPSKAGSESSESDDLTSETYEKTEPNAEKNHEVVITTEKYVNLNSTIVNKDVVITITKEPEVTTVGSKSKTSSNKSEVNVESITTKTEHNETKNYISKNEEPNTKIIESTTSGNEGIGQTEPKNYDSSESEEEVLEVKGISEHTRRYNQNSNEKSTPITKSDTNKTGIEYFGVKSMENKSDEHTSVTNTDIEEFSTSANLDSTTNDIMPTTHNVDAFANISSTTYKITQGTEKELDTTTEYSFNTLTSTLTDERTTDTIAETTSYSPSTGIVTTEVTTSYPIESTSRSVTTTEDLEKVVEDITTIPTSKNFSSITQINSIKKDTNNNLEFSNQTKKIKLIKQHLLVKDITTTTINLEEESIEPTTQRNKPKVKVHKVETVIRLPKNVYDTTINGEQSFQKTKFKTKHVKNNLSVDKNFIELEKVYYDNNYRVKVGNKYNVYEIPADKSPFIQEEQIMSEQPYYVPIYNYAPNHAYFNPVNRLGPNPEDASQDEAGVFGLVDDINSPEDSNDNFRSQNYDNIDYSGSTYDIKRKKFGSKQKLTHSIHKMPQQSDSHEKKRGKVNPEDYLDSDYYFGRVRKDLERRDNNYDQFPNSNEYDHPTHSIQELSLKDHVRAVRNILYQQKKFGLPDRQGRERKLRSKPKETDGIKTKPNKLLIKNDHSITRHGIGDGKNKRNDVGDNNIAIDYYFGRMKPTAVFTSQINNDSKDNHFQRVGYVKNHNNTKELYVMDEFFKENVVKYLTEIQTKDKTYVKAGLMPVTPHPIPKMKNRIKNDTLTRFRSEEMKRNADLMRNFKRNQTVTKREGLANIKELKTIDFLQMGSYDKNNTLKNKISSVRKEAINDKLNSSMNQEMNLRLNRRNDVVKVGVYIQVLKDMISLDNKALKQYDWLGTTVDIQSSLQKLFELIDLIVNDDTIHPADLEILRYVLFLHKLATEIIQANDFGTQLRKKLILPRNKKKEKHHMLKEKGLINRVWLYLRREVPEINEDKALKKLYKFLMDTENGLYNLHDAVKNIAKITKYKNQNWYQNLKELYLNTDEKNVLELLLHMTVSRLFELIEDSAKNGLEDDYIDYMKENKKTAKKTLEEMLFAIQILDEINKTVD